MELYSPNPFESDEKPDKTGESKAPKKRKRKTTKLSLKNSPEKSQDSTEKTNEKKQKKVIVAKKAGILPELELPEESKDLEVEHIDSDYKGELVIDHSETDSEAVDNQPEKIEFEPEVAAVLESEPQHESPELPTEPVETVDEPSRPPRVAPPIFFTANQKPAENLSPPTENQESVPPPHGYEALDSEQSTPAGHRMIDPNIYQAVHQEAPERFHAAPVKPISQEDANVWAIRSEKRGLSRGVVAGGVVGWLLGRRGKRAAERETQAAIASRDKQAEQFKAERNQYKETTERRLGVVERTQEELRKLMNRPVPETKPVSVPKPENKKSSSLRESVPQISKPENKFTYSVPESVRPTFETASAVRKEETIPSKKTKEKLPVEDREITEETYQPPAGRRVETSAWHRIEIDEKTGKTVEKPTVAYGEAFTSEQRQERLQREAAQAQTAAQVGVTLLHSMPSTTTSNSTLSLNQSGSGQARESIKRAVSNLQVDTSFIKQQFIYRTTSPATWVIALLLVVLLFATDNLTQIRVQYI